MEQEKHDQPVKYIVRPAIAAAVVHLLNCGLLALTLLAYVFQKSGISFQFFLGLFQLVVAITCTFTISEPLIQKLFKYYWRAVLLCFVILGLLSLAESGSPHIPMLIAGAGVPLAIASFHVYITHQILNHFRK